MDSDRAFGLAYVCERCHSGQWSKGYRVLCKLGVEHRTDRAARLLPREEWAEARVWAAHYTRVAWRNPRMF
jgi:hypothetical protein